MSRPRPSPAVEGLVAYSVPRTRAPVDLLLDGNEGATPSTALMAALAAHGPDVLRSYPDARPLEARLARRLGITPDRVLVTAGADDALDRACRAFLAPGRDVIVPVPGFSMLLRYARMSGAEVVEVPWTDAAYPTDAVLAAVTDRTALIVITHPNNPTGGFATATDLRRLAAAAPGAVLLVDLAYVEFADTDLTADALALPHTVLTRTLSKAYGLAGIRVGYAAGSAELLSWMRTAGAPYAVSGPSLALAVAQLDEDPDLSVFVGEIRRERAALSDLLTGLGARPAPSQGNFVLARFTDALWVRDGLAGLGIAVRAFPGDRLLDDALRITLPGDPVRFERLCDALRTVLAPEALLLDMDGVLADVRGSYRVAIEQTAAAFGVAVTAADVGHAKAAGNANNDWVLTQRLLAARGVDAPLDEVTARFEAIYQTLTDRELLMVARPVLEALRAKVRLAVVTGRPRADAARFLDQHGIADLFDEVVCMEDAPMKPDPAPVRVALRRLGVDRAWMVGDTPDDARAARGAEVLPLGVVPPGDDPSRAAAAIVGAGAGRMLGSVDELVDRL